MTRRMLWMVAVLTLAGTVRAEEVQQGPYIEVWHAVRSQTQQEIAYWIWADVFTCAESIRLEVWRNIDGITKIDETVWTRPEFVAPGEYWNIAYVRSDRFWKERLNRDVPYVYKVYELKPKTRFQMKNDIIRVPSLQF